MADMAFPPAKSGLLNPNPGGLAGFQRQGMDQRKKASGVQSVQAGTGGSNVAIPVSTSGAVLGDIVLYFSPFNNLGVLSGTGWSGWSDVTPSGYTYTAYVQWAVLTALADITVTGESYGHAWAIYRGAVSVAQNGVSVANPAVVAPLNAKALATVVFASNQASQAASVGPPGFTNRAHGYVSAVFSIDVLDTAPSPGVAGSKAFTAFPASGGTLILEIAELRGAG